MPEQPDKPALPELGPNQAALIVTVGDDGQVDTCVVGDGPAGGTLASMEDFIRFQIGSMDSWKAFE